MVDEYKLCVEDVVIECSVMFDVMVVEFDVVLCVF